MCVVVLQLDVLTSLSRRVVVVLCCVASLLCVLDASLPLRNWDPVTRGSSVVTAQASEALSSGGVHATYTAAPRVWSAVTTERHEMCV